MGSLGVVCLGDGAAAATPWQRPVLSNAHPPTVSILLLLVGVSYRGGYQGFRPTRNDSGQHGANTGPTWEKHMANTEATQANTGSNTGPTRSASDVPTGRCGANTKPMPWEENANRSQNKCSSNYIPIIFCRGGKN